MRVLTSEATALYKAGLVEGETFADLAGGLGMIAIGVGGADAVDVMTGMEWELKII